MDPFCIPCSTNRYNTPGSIQAPFLRFFFLASHTLGFCTLPRLRGFRLRVLGSPGVFGGPFTLSGSTLLILALSPSSTSLLGGVLKTSKNADSESLQAGWYPRVSLPTPLRAHDVVHLVELGAKFCQQATHPLILPQELPCSVVCQRLVATFTTVQSVWVLVGTVGTPHLPITACGFTPMEQRGGIKVAILRLLQECLTLHSLAVETKGLLGLQHLGRDHVDGICLNVLVTVAFRNPGIQDEPPKIRGENYFWWKVLEEDLQKQLLHRLQESSVVPLTR